MPAPAVVAPRRKPKSLRSTQSALIASLLTDVGRMLQTLGRGSRVHRVSERITHPPRKAPIGFLIGAAPASCLNTELVWKPRAGAWSRGTLRVAVRTAGAKTRDAIDINGPYGVHKGVLIVYGDIAVVEVCNGGVMGIARKCSCVRRAH